MSLVVLFSYQNDINVSKSKTVTKILSNSIKKKLWEKISFHQHFKGATNVEFKTYL